ncbi:MAG: carbohydrate-binding protein [Armatimonadetes bacterium]|nr:carbohydrate-binding protein [Armatimonadota bacterium]
MAPLFLLLVGLSATAPTVAPYQWSNVTIVAGGFMPGIVFHPKAPGVAYIRSDMGGAYRLDPVTRRWVPLMDFTRDYVETGVESIALDPTNADRVYLACGTATADWAPRGFLLRSDDRGQTLERIPLPFKCGGNDDGRSIGERLAVNPRRTDELWMGTRQAGLWRSTDRGRTWTQVSSFHVTDTSQGPWRNIGVGFVLFTPTGTMYVGSATTPTSLWQSRDEGASWAPVVGQPTGMVPHHAQLASNGLLYVTWCDQPGPNGVGDSQVWKLNTATGAWTNITPNAQPGKKLGYGYAGLAVDAQHPDTLMVSTTCRWWPGDDQWRSIDGGATWKQVGPTARRDPSISPYLRWGKPATEQPGAGNWEGSIVIDPFNADRVLYVTGATVWGCDDITALDRGEPTHWSVRGEGIEQVAVKDLVSPTAGPHLVSGMADIGGFVHDDLTVSPQQGMMSPYMTNRSLDVAGLAPNVVVRVGDGIKIPGCLSADGAHTWRTFASAPVADAKGGSVALTADGSAVVWSPGGQPAFRTVDGGATWARAAGIDGPVVLSADRADARRVYALPARRDDTPATLLVSVDGGLSFRSAASGLRGRQPKAVPGLAGGLWLAASDGLWRSTDGGATFARLPGVTSALSVAFGMAAPGQTHPAVFASATIDGTAAVYRSDDAGAKWLRVNDDEHQWGGLYGALAGDMRVFGRFYLGTNGRGIIMGQPRP